MTRALAINKNISELLRNGNDIGNMHFSVASFERRQNNSQENTKKVNRKVQEEPQAEAAANPRHQEEEKKQGWGIPTFWAVMRETNKTQPLALNLSSIYRINH